MQPLIFFFRLWTWFSFRHLSAHRWRALSVLLGIALGAAVFTSVRIAINASMDSFSRSVDLLSGKADRVVIKPGGRVPEYLVAQIAKHPAVRAVSPILSTYVRSDEKPSEPFLLIGLDPISDRTFRAWRPASAETGPSLWLDLMSRPDTLLAGPRLSRSQHLTSGDELVLSHVQYRRPFKVLGTLDREGLALVDGGDVALTDIATFQEFTGVRGEVDRIDIALKPGAKESELNTLREILPEGVLLEMPGESKESGRMMIQSYQLNLSVLSFVSLFVGMFLVYSLVSLHATSRRGELSVLRSLGASSRVLFLLFLAEGAFFGIVGWLIAVPLGALLVEQLLGQISSTITHLFVRVQVESLVLDPWEPAASFLITVLISVLAACQPALEAMRVHPRESLLMLNSCPERNTAAGRLALLGSLLILLVQPVSQLGSASRIPVQGYIATFLLFCGFSLLSPAILRIMGSILPPFLRRIGGEPAYLGGRYIRDAGTRVAISVGALITAMALFVALVIMVHSFRKTVDMWVHQSITGDIFLRPRMSDLNKCRYSVPEEVVASLKCLQTPVDILPYRRIYLAYEGVPYQFETIDIDVFTKHARFLLVEGDMESILPQLRSGEGVLVSEVFSNQTGLKPGMRFRSTIQGVPLDLPVLGISRDYRTQGGVVHYSFSRFAELSQDPSWSGARIHLSSAGPDAASAVLKLRNEILTGCIQQQHAIDITIGSDLRREIMRIFDDTFAVTTVLLLIALLVAALGITTTLTVMVLERKHQLHTMIAVGAGTGQLRAMVAWEAVLMVLAGEAVGFACGFLLSNLLIYVINRQSFGWTFIYSVDWGALAASVPLILATALMAALPASELIFKHPSAVVLRDRQL